MSVREHCEWTDGANDLGRLRRKAVSPQYEMTRLMTVGPLELHTNVSIAESMNDEETSVTATKGRLHSHSISSQVGLEKHGDADTMLVEPLLQRDEQSTCEIPPLDGHPELALPPDGHAGLVVSDGHSGRKHAGETLNGKPVAISAPAEATGGTGLMQQPSGRFLDRQAVAPPLWLCTRYPASRLCVVH